MDEELRRMIEAILFAAGKKIELEHIVKLCKRSPDDILLVLREWKTSLDESNSPTMLIEDGSGWKLTVREKYLPVIKRVVSKTELPKSILETLAIVAYKAPVLQSKVVKLRTNKAYEHLNYLENSQMISREKKGRTKLIRVTPKFFEYFDIDPSQLKKKFGDAASVERAIESKEKEIEDFEIEQRRQTSENLEKPKVVVDGKALETYNASVDLTGQSLPPGVEVAEDKVGNLEVYDSDINEKEAVHKKHHKKKEKLESTKEVDEEVKEQIVENVEEPSKQVVEEKIEVERAVEQKPKKKSHKKEEVIEVSEEVKEEPLKEEVKEEVVEVDKFSPEAISDAAQKKAQKLRSKEGKGLFQKGVPPQVEQKIEERISKLMRGEDDESSEESETPSPEKNQEEKQE